MIGQRLGRFRIVERLGTGGLGDGYRARDEQLERDVALVVLPAASFPDAAARARLLDDARAASKLNHPNICAIHEVGEADPSTVSPGSGQAGFGQAGVFVAMELVAGQPLSARLAEGPLRPDELLRYGLPLTDALAYAHEHGVVHGDLKSANAIVTPDGRLKVLGFGLPRPSSQDKAIEATTAPQTAPPPHATEALGYTAPEQLHGQPADARSDVWALGVLLQEMATGQRPFQGNTSFELGSAILNEMPPPLPPNAPVELQAIVERCLRKEPGQRYRRASDVHAALEAMQSSAALPRREAAGKGWIQYHWLAVGTAALVLVVAVVAAALYVGALVGRRQGPAQTPAPMLHALAVLPLANLTGDPDQKYFVDGLTDALINHLAEIGGALRVISRTSTEVYGRAPKPIPQIGRDLGVEAIVEGSVAREGDLVRVTASLIEAATERRLWSDRYERNLTSILTIQADIARAVARSIKGALSPEEERKVARAREVNPRVYELYLRGMDFLQQSTPDAFQKGMDYLHQAVELDPTDALAYAGLADGYVTLAHGPDSTTDALLRARAAAQTAVDLDPLLPQGVFALGVVKGYDEWNWADGERDLRRAIDLNESFAMAHYHLAWFLAIQGNLPEAIVEHIRARDVDPLNPLHTAWLGELYRIDGKYEKALAEVRKAMELDRQFPISQFVLSLIYADQGKWDEAIEAMRQTKWQWGLPAMYAAAGRTGEARSLLAKLESQKVNPWNALWRTIIYAALGEKDAAFKWANHRPKHVWLPAVFLREWQVFARPLHGDPRFTEMQRRMNVPKYPG